MATAIALPRFAGVARKAEEAADGERGAKAKKLVQEAQAAASGGRRGKGNQKDVMEQLVLILTRLTLANSNDLREVMGMLLKTYLVPEKHVLAVSALKAGKEYQEAAKKQRESREAKESEAEDEEDSDLEDDKKEKDKMDEDKLGAPHLVIAMQSMHQLLVADRSQWGDEAKKALQELEKAWVGLKIAEMEETQATQIVKVWKARKPQKQAKGHKMGKYVKLNFAMDDRLACSLHQVLLLTGCVEKAGKAPRGFLEREAARLLQKFQK